MPREFFHQISAALGSEMQPEAQYVETASADLHSCFAVTDLAVASIASAALELGQLLNARKVAVDRRLASLWFDMTLRPDTWSLPSAWDDIAGVYQTSCGWIRLHTNAPHHRAAALDVLGCKADKGAVADAVSRWETTDLETAVVAAGGAAAGMMSHDQWKAHPQGSAVNQEPLIAWSQVAEEDRTIALKGAKVLDLTRVLAGPVATRFLAGYGAQVLRIDPPWWGEPGVEPEVTLGKLRAGLDLGKTEDRRRFENLLSEADVLVHGYRPGALAGLGFGPESLRKIAPALIDVSLCAYGHTGPWADRRGFDSLVQMSCGITHEGMTRKDVDHPVPLPVQALDHATGYLMAAAVLRAIRMRNQNGRIMSARLSLARTAALLMSTGARDFVGQEVPEQPSDLSFTEENTGWGPAKRIRFPVLLDGKEPVWTIPAGPLRVDAPRWQAA